MNFNSLLSALWARRRLFFLIWLTTVAATLIISLMVPKSYVADVAVLVNGKDEQSMRNGYAPPEWDRTGYVQTQVGILTSPKVARRVIADLNLTENPVAQALYKSGDGVGSIEDWLAANLVKKLKTDFSQSSVIQFTFSSPDPAFSAQVANAFAKAYVDTALDLRVEPMRQTSLWFDEQLKTLRDNMELAEKRLAEFQQQTGIVSLDERYDADTIQLSGLADQVARAHGAAADARSGAEDPGINTLRSDLSRAEAKLQELAVELGARHPQYLRQRAEVEALRSRVNADVAGAAERSRKRNERLQAQLDSERKHVLGLKQARNRLAGLNRDFEIAQRTYDTAMQRFMASKIESRASLTNVSVLSPAVPPAEAARPKPGLNAMVAAVVGALLGLAGIYLSEMADRRVRTQGDVAEVQVPLLAVLHDWNPDADRLLSGPEHRFALPGPG